MILKKDNFGEAVTLFFLVSMPGSLNEETVLNVITTTSLGTTKKNHFLR